MSFLWSGKLLKRCWLADLCAQTELIMVTASKKAKLCGEQLEQRVMNILTSPLSLCHEAIFVIHSVGQAGVAIGYVKNRKVL